MGLLQVFNNKFSLVMLFNFWFGMYYILLVAFGLLLFNFNIVHAQKEVSHTGDAKVKRIMIASILPNDNQRMFSIAKSSPAIQIAIEEVKKRSLLPRHDLVVKYTDSKCSGKWGPLAAFNFYMNRDVHVFLGPTCDYALAPVARYAPEWNLPVISTGGFAHDFGNKNVTSKEESFPSLTRVHLTFGSVGDLFVNMFRHYNWATVKVIYFSEGHSNIIGRFCYLAISAIIKRIRQIGNSVRYHLYLVKEEEAAQEYQNVFHEIGRDYAGKDVNLFSHSACNCLSLIKHNSIKPRKIAITNNHQYSQ